MSGGLIPDEPIKKSQPEIMLKNYKINQEAKNK